ncbi:hypothetical protein ACJRO7_034415 [Eucalyptus globulus]|uniref:Uncharacterized protein n=1 Tax=Eucalyptus globulus TaxID=34317 RepID=A0ABD3J6G9_EUCGL
MESIQTVMRPIFWRHCWHKKGTFSDFSFSFLPFSMSRGQSRLSIPNKQIRQGFLSEEEIRILNRKEGIKVSLIELCLEVSHGLRLKKWNYTSKIFSYMLTERWNAVAHPYTRNELMKDVVIQVWSFRVDGSLWFCLKKVEAPMRQWKGWL